MNYFCFNAKRSSHGCHKFTYLTSDLESILKHFFIHFVTVYFKCTLLNMKNHNHLILTIKKSFILRTETPEIQNPKLLRYSKISNSISV